MRLQRLFPWAVRAAWAVLPFTLGPALAAALDGRSRPVQAVASVALWAGWAVVVAATLVPRPLGLTALRIAAPAAAAAAVAATADHHGSALAVGTAAVVLALAFLPENGMLFANGAAYPNERRFPLRVPGPLLLGPLPLAWAVAIGVPAAGALLLATGRWVAGAVVLAAGLPVAALLLRALHGLSRRWLVFVPAGVVLHDPIGLADPVLFRRQLVEALRPAPADSDALDLTQQAPGLALELLLREKVPMVRQRPGRRGGEPGASARLLFTPTRPGAVLREARARRLPDGSASA
jgi:hypothetical protein